MPTRPPHLDALLQTLLREEDDAPPPAVDLEAALSDPLLRGVIERALQPYERIFSEKGMERARRTLVQVFTSDPAAVSALAKLREQGASGATTAAQPGARPANSRRQRRKP
jgi:hypothetical protein